MTMRVIVTGGAGYIGSHVSLALHKAGHKPVVVDDYTNSSPCSIDRLSILMDRPVDFHEIDVCNWHDLQQVFASRSPDAVIHCAGLKAVSRSQSEPLLYYEKNIQGAVNVLRAMDTVDVSKIIFSSSATVYGHPLYLPYDENHRLQPENVYGRTKLFVEQIIRDWQMAANDRSAILLRYFNPIGSHKSGKIGENPNDIPQNLMPYILDVASGKRSRLRVFGNDYDTPDGTCIRDFIHVQDLADGHVSALSHAFKRTGVDVFNLGTGRGHSVLEVIASFERATGVSVPYDIDDRRSGDIAAFYADVKKARETLGWTAVRDIDTMCIDSWRWCLDSLKDRQY